MMMNPHQSKELYVNILSIGNELLNLIGVAQRVYNIQEFQVDTFYMQICEFLFPEVSLEEMSPGVTVDQMADNINAIIDYIEEIAPELDLTDLDGYLIVTGDLQSMYMLLSKIVILIQSTLEDEEEYQAMLEQQEKMEQENNKARQKERELQEKQLLEDPTALPVGNVMDLLKKKKKNKEIITNEEKSGKSSAKKQQPVVDNKKKQPTPKKETVKPQQVEPPKVSKQVDDIWKNLESNQGLDDYLQDDSDFDIGDHKKTSDKKPTPSKAKEAKPTPKKSPKEVPKTVPKPEKVEDDSDEIEEDYIDYSNYSSDHHEDHTDSPGKL